MSSRTAWIIIGIAVVVAAVIVIGLNLGGPGGGPSPSPQPSGSGAPSAMPSGSAEGSPDVSASAPSQAGGMTWEALAGPEPGAQIHGLAVVDGRWLALGGVFPEPRIWFSDDEGDSWTVAGLASERSEDEYSLVTRLAVVGGDLIAIGSWGLQQSDQASFVTWRSTDAGESWEEARGNELALRAIAPGGPGLVAAGWDATGTTPFTSWIGLSDDGDTWERVDAPSFTDAEIDAVAAFGDRLVAVGNVFDGTEYVPAAWYSDDGGQAWEPGTVDGGVGTLRAVMELGGQMVAVGGAGTPTAWLSADGASWSPVEMGAEGNPNSLAAVDAGLVAVGNGGGQEIGPEQAWTTADGSAWDPGEPIGDASVRLIAAAGTGSTVLAGGACLADGCETVMWRGRLGD